MEKILALDVGDATIGVAISDALGIAAHPVTTIRRTSEKEDIARVEALLTEHRAARILVGEPRMLNGSLGAQAQKVNAFADALRNAVDVPVTMWDERFSTVAAEKALIDSGLTRKRRKKVVDQVAAVFFLQGYLDYLAAGGRR